MNIFTAVSVTAMKHTFLEKGPDSSMLARSSHFNCSYRDTYATTKSRDNKDDGTSLWASLRSLIYLFHLTFIVVF